MFIDLFIIERFIVVIELFITNTKYFIIIIIEGLTINFNYLFFASNSHLYNFSLPWSFSD